MVQGRLEHLGEVSARSYPEAERTYLADGSGLAWSVPSDLRAQARFAVDAEIATAVRPVLVRRYDVADPWEFARRWTRAEASAKVCDIPIIVWLERFGLDDPVDIGNVVVGEFACCTDVLGDIAVSRAVLRGPGSRRNPGVVGGGV